MVSYLRCEVATPTRATLLLQTQMVGCPLLTRCGSRVGKYHLPAATHIQAKFTHEIAGSPDASTPSQMREKTCEVMRLIATPSAGPIKPRRGRLPLCRRPE